MKKQFFIIAFAIFCSTLVAQNKLDSAKMVQLEEVIVNSLKETTPQQAPVSSTLLNPRKINAAQIHSVKDLTAVVPNFFIPDYGSAMSSAIYIRGIGSRNSGQSMALYVDNVPYFERSTFDFDFYDIRQIEVLRGSQGTLYGRNAQGGVVNIYTLSPFNYQGTKLSLSAGNFGLFNAQASHYRKLSEKVGISLSGYYNHTDGFFVNKFNGQSADDKTSAGGRAKLDWNFSPKFKAQYGVNFDFVDQSAFPYGLYNKTTGITDQPNFNDEGSYTRTMLTNSLLLQYITDKFVLSSTTSHQYFKDDMKMDNDFSAMSFFSLRQQQKQNALNEEINIKSTSKNNYQWSFGATGFLQQLDLDAPFDMKSDGIKYILQPVFTKIATCGAPLMTITDNVMTTPGTFNTKTYGGAIFHQSTINNIIVNGLSATAGLRLDYEKVELDYNTGATLNVNMKAGPSTIPYQLKTLLKDNLSVPFTEFLPKFALKYEWSNKQFVYANVSRGYKAGGYNVQMFADLVNNGLMNSQKPAPNKDIVSSIISYKPEFSMNYEIGSQCVSFNNHLKSSISLYYIDVTNMQLTQFVPNGLGRKISNGGQVASKGLELSLDAALGGGFSASANYGYAHAAFTSYTDSVKVSGVSKQVDYKGKFVPYAPQHTLNLSASYEKVFVNQEIDRLMATIQYNGVGKIYWNEANDVAQNFYSTVNAKLAISKGGFGLELWAKNLFNTDYNAFYFYTAPSTLFQKGKPLQMGVTLKMEL